MWELRNLASINFYMWKLKFIDFVFFEPFIENSPKCGAIMIQEMDPVERNLQTHVEHPPKAKQ